MSLVGPAIFAQLTSNTAVAAIVAARVFPQYVRQKNNVYPLACYHVSNVTGQLASDGPTGLESADVKIACIAATDAAAGALAKSVQAALDGQTGTWGGVTVQGCFLKDDGISDDTVTEPSTEEILFYVKLCEFQIWYSNT